MREQSRGGGSSIREVEQNRALLKQARGLSILALIGIYLLESGVVVLLSWLDSAATERIQWIICFLVVFALGAQANGEMRVNKRMDALVSLLIHKGMFDDEVAQTRLTLDAGGSTSRKK